MEARHGRALSWREQRELIDIEQDLREDAKLDRALRTMRLGRFFRLRRERKDREPQDREPQDRERKDSKRQEPWPWG